MEKVKKKTTTKKSVKKVTKKAPVKELRYKKYIYPSIIFGFMLACFNYIFLILALYSPCYSGIYVKLFDSVVLNVFLNTIFQILFFAAAFFFVSYLFVEVVINKHN